MFLTGAQGYPPSVPNYIAGGKRPLSSMTPVVVERDGRLFVAAGASGGSRIITGVLQTLLQTLRAGRNVLDAVSLPRLHDQLLPVELALEVGFDAAAAQELVQLGHHVVHKQPPWYDAVVQAVRVDESGITAACDWRKLGHSDDRCLVAGY